ncbi:MAG TPA: glucose-6-phosphate dehydrogenase assembly protein OpcA [Isosphaeraceae bacterium]|jgi:glucose-6-phosphate dehydrogenase assembly protein OpcA
MSDLASQPIIAGPVEVSLSDVESTLSRLLREADAPCDTPLHRARMSNLIIHCQTSERAAEVEPMIPEIVSIHPARVLLLVADDHSGSPEIQASALVRKAGREAQLCSEQITLRGGRHAVEHLPFAVRGLQIGDLPTNVWWTNPVPPALAGPILDDLTEYAQQVIYDSLGWPDPHRGVAATAAWLARFERDGSEGRWRVASDLNWRRLKPWRRMIGQALAPTATPGALDTVSEILVEHGPHAVTQAWQLAGWLASRLGWKIRASKLRDNVELDFQLLAPQGALRLRIDRLPDGPSELRRVRFSCALDGKLGALDITGDGTRIVAIPEGMDASPRTLAIQKLDTAEIVARQLSDREPDPVFREAMTAARVLAQAVLY